MNVFCQSQLGFSDQDKYVEKHKLFRLFQYVLERIIINRPTNPVTYIRQLLTRGFNDAQQVFILGEPTVARKLISSTLYLKLNLVHLTRDSLIQNVDEDLQQKLDELNDLESVPDILWSELAKNRLTKADCLRKGFVLEGFPRTREQAFRMLKAGLFPTHIVCIELKTKNNMGFSVYVEEEMQEVKDFRVNYPLLVDFFKDQNIKFFKLESSVFPLVHEIEAFLRNKEASFLPYVPRILLFGPPGSGKKTLISKLSNKYPLKEVHFQEVLRQAILSNGQFKQKLEDILLREEQVPDDLLAQIVAVELLDLESMEYGWILEGFPFNIAQAEALTTLLEGFQVNKAIFLEANFETSIRRLEGRSYDPQTGVTYHPLDDPPPYDIRERLIYRDEDTRNEIEDSFNIYKSHCIALQGYYSRKLQEDVVFFIDANLDPLESVFEVLESLILGSSRRKVPDSEWFESPARDTGIY